MGLTLKEGKQAEFLLHESLPLALVEKIGVIDEETAAAVELATGGEPTVAVERYWYY